MSQSLSEKGADPFEASRFHRFYSLVGEVSVPLEERVLDISSFKTLQIFRDKDAPLNRYERYSLRQRCLD
jgi:hypothetical protein